MKIFLIIFCGILLIGCSGNVREHSVNVTERRVELPEPPAPSSMDIQDIHWEACGQKLCVDAREFEKIQNNFLEASRMIRSLRENIEFYRRIRE
jgi:hypothetical protein